MVQTKADTEDTLP